MGEEVNNIRENGNSNLLTRDKTMKKPSHHPERPGQNNTKFTVEGYDLNEAAEKAERERLGFIRAANKQIRILQSPTTASTQGMKSEVVKEAEDFLRRATERGQHLMKNTGSGRTRSQKPEINHGGELSINYIAREVVRDPVMKASDYPERGKTIAKIVDKLQDDPSSAGFGGLTEILDAEKKDVLAKKEKLEDTGIKDYQAAWIEIKLQELKIAKEGLRIMIDGKKLMDNDSRAMMINDYIRGILEQLEEGKRASKNGRRLQEIRNELLEEVKGSEDYKGFEGVINKKEILKAANNTIPVIETYYRNTLEYGIKPVTRE